jgi:hypothetical protein
MTRGGERSGAGRKSTWASGCTFENTKLIRVPSKIADQVLKLAHQLDAGEIDLGDHDLVTNSKSNARQGLDVTIPLIKIEPITQSLLAKRLGLTTHQIAKAKGKTGKNALRYWSAAHDPDSITWSYNSKVKKYIPTEDLTLEQSSRLVIWLSKQSGKTQI